jgi:hypothetical protein
MPRYLHYQEPFEVERKVGYKLQVRSGKWGDAWDRATWAFPYWPGYHPETPILARDAVEGQYGSKDDNQVNMEMPMY